MVNLCKLDLCGTCDCVDLSSPQKHTTATLPLVALEACGGPAIVRQAEIFVKKGVRPQF